MPSNKESKYRGQKPISMIFDKIIIIVGNTGTSDPFKPKKFNTINKDLEILISIKFIPFK